MRLVDSAARAALNAEILAREAQAIAARYVEHYGYKQGLHQFGLEIGEGDRRARAIYSGEARRLEAHELLLAREADIALKRIQLAQSAERARQLLRELKDSKNAEDFVGDSARLCVGRAGG